MTETIRHLSATEYAYVLLLDERREHAKRVADAEYVERFAVVCQQFGIPDGTRVHVLAGIGPVPPRLVYDAPDAPSAPAPDSLSDAPPSSPGTV